VKTVTAAYAKAHLPELLTAVSRGQHVTISRYRKPVAVLMPAPDAEKPKFGTGKGKVKLLDPRAFDPMTDEEVYAFVEGRY
jgi:prevent-host-death family protein